jgi:hypothetical protein
MTQVAAFQIINKLFILQQHQQQAQLLLYLSILVFNQKLAD